MKPIDAGQLIRSLELIVQSSKETNVCIHRPIVQGVHDALRLKVQGTLNRPPLTEMVGLTEGAHAVTAPDAYRLLDILKNVLNTQERQEVILSRPVLVSIIGELRGTVAELLDIYDVEGVLPPMVEIIEDPPPLDPAWRRAIVTDDKAWTGLWQVADELLEAQKTKK